MRSCEYAEEFGADELSSEQFRANKFPGKPLYTIQHWEQIWSRYYLIDWIIHLKELGYEISYSHVSKHARSLTSQCIYHWGSWDRAVQVAGFRPKNERRYPPGKSWTKETALEALKEHAAAIAAGTVKSRPVSLDMALRRLFGSPKAAAEAAGLSYDQILLKRVFDSDDVERLVDELRSLAQYKGKERCSKLQEIQRRNATNFRIIRGRYTSLRKLAQAHGLDPETLATKAYRNPEDVHHDLDLIERRELPLCYQTLRNGHLSLYETILNTGWGLERLEGRLSKRLAAGRAKPPLSK
jgi:hypothetical protein